jgi:hypothetical protein
MDHNNHNAPFLTMLTGGLWLMQKFLFLAKAFLLADMASLATIFSGMAAGSYWLYSLYKKWKNDRVLEKDNES